MSACPRPRGGGRAHLRTGDGRRLPPGGAQAADGGRRRRPLRAGGKPRDRTWPLHLTLALGSEHGTSQDEFMEKPFFNATS